MLGAMDSSSSPSVDSALLMRSRSRLQLLLFAGFVCQQASFRDYRVNLRHEGHSRR